MPSLRQLEYLVALDDYRHFRRAAEHCGVSQPTLSAQLQALEARLGAQMVERQRTGILMTAAGGEVAKIARRVLKDIEEIRHLANSQGGGLGGFVRMGLAPTVGPYLLPRMIADLHQSYPMLKLYVREDLPSTLPTSLEAGRHDVIVMPLPIQRADLETEALFREPLYLAMPSDHPLATRKRIDRRDLRGMEILAIEPGHNLHSQVEGLCAEVGARLLTDYEGTSLDTLREMVGMGMGLSFLPGLYVNTSLRQDPSITIVQVSGAPIYRTIGLIWRRTSVRAEQFRALAGHFRTAVRREFPDFTIL